MSIYEQYVHYFHAYEQENRNAKWDISIWFTDKQQWRIFYYVLQQLYEAKLLSCCLMSFYALYVLYYLHTNVQ